MYKDFLVFAYKFSLVNGTNFRERSFQLRIVSIVGRWLTERKRRSFQFMQSTHPNNGDHLLPDVVPACFRWRAGRFNRDDAGSLACTLIGRSGSFLNLFRKLPKKCVRGGIRL